MPTITAENAKEFARRSLAKRLQNLAKLKEAAAITETLSAVATAQAETSESFLLNILARIRKQIAETLDMLDDDDVEPVDRERLSRSLGVLLEQDRQLSGRPLPGTLKPTGKPAKPRTTYAEPTPENAAMQDRPVAPEVFDPGL